VLKFQTETPPVSHRLGGGFPLDSQPFRTRLSPTYPQVIHRVINPPQPVHRHAILQLLETLRRAPIARGSAEQAPVIAEDHTGGVVAGGAGDAAAGVRAASAMVEAP
jgi:hypothetical protein